MVVDTAAILAYIRGAKPLLKNKADCLAFLIHARLILEDYRLVSVGAAEDYNYEILGVLKFSLLCYCRCD